MNGQTEHTTAETSAVYAGRIKRCSWAAIFAGVFVVIGVQLLLGSLGTAVGLETINPGEEEAPMSGLGVGAGIWWIISTIVALFVGGWAAGRLAGFPTRISGILHGAVTWSFATLLGLFLMYSIAGAIVGGLWNVTATTVQAAGQAAGQAVSAVAPEEIDVPQQAWQTIQQQATQLLGEGGQADGQGQGQQEVSQALRELFLEDRDPMEISQEDQQAVVEVLVANTDMTQQQAQRQVRQWVSRYQQAAQQLRRTLGEVPERAEQVAATAAELSADIAWWTFFSFLVGSVAAVIGGLLGAPGREVEVRQA